MLKKIYILFIVPYTVFLLYLMLFGFGREQFDDNVVRFQPIFSTYLFVKNKLLWSDYKNLAINILGNIVMFVPFGFLGIVYQKMNNLKNLLLFFLSFLVIVEALQYFSRMGVFDIDDLLLNSFGVLIGFWIYKNYLCKKCYNE